jgi:hypoxanthine phosphoribosyltransferase
VPVKLVDWKDIVEWSKGLSEKIRSSGWSPDVVVAVSRGGFVPARLICDFLDISDLLSIQSQHWVEAAKAAELINPKYVIPMHYGTFPVIKGSPEEFKERGHQGLAGR